MLISCRMDKVQKNEKYGVEKSELRGPNASRAFATRRLKIPNCSVPSADEDGATKQRKNMKEKYFEWEGNILPFPSRQLNINFSSEQLNDSWGGGAIFLRFRFLWRTFVCNIFNG